MTNIASGFALALHGDAGTLRCGEMTAEPGGLPAGCGVHIQIGRDSDHSRG